MIDDLAPVVGDWLWYRASGRGGWMGTDTAVRVDAVSAGGTLTCHAVRLDGTVVERAIVVRRVRRGTYNGITPFTEFDRERREIMVEVAKCQFTHVSTHYRRPYHLTGSVQIVTRQFESSELVALAAELHTLAGLLEASALISEREEAARELREAAQKASR